MLVRDGEYPAQVFAGGPRASSYCYAETSWAQSGEGWIGSRLRGGTLRSRSGGSDHRFCSRGLKRMAKFTPATRRKSTNT